jgi:preprotein translocase subunit SecE
MSRIVQFLRSVSTEMKKVSWPRKKELTRYTITVITTVLFLSVFFAIVDLGISELINLIIE